MHTNNNDCINTIHHGNNTPMTIIYQEMSQYLLAANLVRLPQEAWLTRFENMLLSKQLLRT